MNVINVYTDFLSGVNKKRSLEKKDKEFHASAAGSCYRKQMYSYFGYKGNELDEKSLRLLRLGTIVHKDMEESMIKYKNDNYHLDIYIEHKINIPLLNVVGTFDLGEKRGKEFNLYDYKTVAAYKWSTKFGRKINRNDTTDKNYKLQLGTYGLGILQNMSVEKINMKLIWYNKNTSMMREQSVDSSYINEAEEYWITLNDILEDYGEFFESSDMLEPGLSYGSPFEDWECRYCQFSDICPTPIKTK